MQDFLAVLIVNWTRTKLIQELETAQNALVYQQQKANLVEHSCQTVFVKVNITKQSQFVKCALKEPFANRVMHAHSAIQVIQPHRTLLAQVKRILLEHGSRNQKQKSSSYRNVLLDTPY